ncbi:MAG: hypothetical protein HQL97_04270 [Magnetococcales bacterium]|nr:hypothetical protein [Magnetococcales bacterium]
MGVRVSFLVLLFFAYLDLLEGVFAGQTGIVRKATTAEPAQKKIYQAVGFNPSPGAVKKMVV